MARADTQLFKIVVSTGRKVRLSGLCTLTAQVPPTRPFPRMEGCKRESFVAWLAGMEYPSVVRSTEYLRKFKVQTHSGQEENVEELSEHVN